MTDQSGGNEMQTEQSSLKRKLAWRMGFAGAMIVMLLGSLAVFDYLSSQDETESSAPSFTEPVPVPKKEMTQPVKPAEPVAEASTDAKQPAEPEASAAPVEPPARPEVSSQPVLPGAQSAAVPRALPQSRSPSSTLQAPVATPPAPSRPPAEAQAAAPATRQQAAPAGASTLGGRLFSGFALQAGVFSDVRRAEELHAKLTLNGIPSTIEARVQVGPFKTRAEAEAAREKMQGLGIDAVLLLPPKGAVRR